MTPREQASPIYELCARGLPRSELSLEIWQLPSSATPRLRAPELMATLRGRALETIEARVLKRLKEVGIKLNALKPGEERTFQLDEDVALSMALLFRVLAPMRSIDRMRMVGTGIDQMSREEAGYWMGMAVHRKNPRRVLAALRMLLSAS